MEINQKQLTTVIQLNNFKRYKYAIRVIADSNELWGLYFDDGWALSKSDDGHIVFPIWPAKEYAEISAEHEWKEYKPTVIPISEFMNNFIPNLEKDNMLVGVFYVPSGKGFIPTIDQFTEDLLTELERY